ncbi:CheR family methyltransferase [Methylobacterium soli]|uniref:CheR family methyltransferase n=1 Tax=Methylobacterium soli TaxID=553447 RepID=UPI001EE2C7C1|nr:CheR family methyltransferase [Methylobacterium soli]GJE42610.1 Protein-glutamate methylesterase/protein-glutamine glutaminase [Methylobacterium soli]
MSEPESPSEPIVEENEGASPALSPVIVGVGASATAIGSIDSFLSHIGDVAGIAYIVVVQYREALDEPRILRHLRQTQGLKAAPIVDGAKVEAGHVYIAGVSSILIMREGRFSVRMTEPNGTERGTIDSFLVSLAEDQGEHAVAVVLGGTGSDGTLGATAVKERGGLTLAEQRDDAHEAGASTSNTAAAIVDFVMPPARMPEHVATYARHLARLHKSRTFNEIRDSVSKHLTRIAAVLRNKTGHDFHGYKQNTFLRRVQRRMQVVQTEAIEAYVDFLRSDPAEVQHLFNDLLIGVTQFFRDAGEFEFVEKEVIPKLFAGKRAGDQVRVWVLGCATGEEAYSLAILLREHMIRLDVVPQVQIFATDIDGRALAAARVGRYSEAIAGTMSPERLTQWFVKEGNTYCIVKELREMCIFSQHSVIKDAPFSRLDLVSCRNLLIYLNNELQNRVIPLFHFALRPNGYLFLGNSENVTRHAKIFAPADRRYRIFRRLDTLTRVLPDFPLATSSVDRSGDTDKTARAREVAGSLTRRAERIAERYAPAYVIIDAAYEVLHFSGRTGHYLSPSPGAASLNLLNLAHRDLRLDLRAALHKAETEGKPVKADRIQMGLNGHRRIVTLIVEPARASQEHAANYVVIFQDGEILEGEEASDISPSFARDEHVQRLEAELRLTRERLQATIEELESTNEELKSSNEEYQSVNEELQSANEELETSKEELQSTNEELQTVNSELGYRVNELDRANSDLKNLLESTQIATVFLDNNFCVKSFTPSVVEIFHLIESDLGRPITHIAPLIVYKELQEDLGRVLRTLGTIEREVENTSTGGRYLVRVLPYRNIDNFIAGVVLTFLDITATARAERALRETEERFHHMERAVPAFLFTLLPNFDCDYLNPRFYEYTGLEAGGALGKGWTATIHPDESEALQAAWESARDGGQPLVYEGRIRDRKGRYRWFTTRAEAMRGTDGSIVKWFGSCTDTHERRRAEDRQRLLLAELQHRVKNILAVVRSVANRTSDSATSLAEFLAHFDGRLGALARTQNILTRTADSSIDLAELIGDEVISYSGRDGEQVTLTGPGVRLRQKAAETLGLALHELATNAIKYGALTGPEGHVAITWRSFGPDGGGERLILEWRESGVRLMNTDPARRGFGRELIEQGLTYELGATTALEFLPGGVRCVIEIPLGARNAAPPLIEIEPGRGDDGQGG